MFTPAQVRQYQDIFTRWFRVDKHAIPRKYNREVLANAAIMGFIERNERGSFYVKMAAHLSGLDLPEQILWAFVKPEIEKCDGFSITRARLWHNLNFDHGALDVERALFKLDRAGYIDFLSAGNVWRIYIKDEHR